MKILSFKCFFICYLFITIAYAQDNKSKVQFIQNKSPKYADIEFITLEEIHRIDVDEFNEYYIYKVWAMDADNDTNLYILDYYECTVTVFDKNGKFLRTMGRKGQGPHDLLNPMSMSIYDNKIYIYEKNKGVKIWNLDGKYVDFILQYKGNFDVYKTVNNFFITCETIIDFNNFNLQKYSLNKYNFNMEFINTIASIEVNIDKAIKFMPYNYVAVNSKLNCYFPEKTFEYIINKYDIDGNIVISFGREYKNIKYSNQIKDYHNKSQSKFPPEARISIGNYPPVVRYIMVDDKDYVWVAVGEWYLDNFGNTVITSTIDIFAENGKFLYTFESPFIGVESLIKNGRLYSTPYENDLNIHVLKINYNY